MAKAEFRTADKRMIVSIQPESQIKYSTLFVEGTNNVIKLGSDSLSRIKEKMIGMLKTKDGQKLIEYEGVFIFPILNLGEPHAALSASNMSDGGVELYVLDINGGFYPVMKLPKPDLSRFITFWEGIE